jgi:anti-anti-sigma factor
MWTVVTSEAKKGAAMCIEEQAIEDGVFWRLCGRLTEGAGDLLEGAVTRAVLHGWRRIVMDLGGVSMIDAGGLGALVRVYRASAASLMALSLVRVPKRARHLLMITRLTTVLAIFDSVEQVPQSEQDHVGLGCGFKTRPRQTRHRRWRRA